MKYRDLEKGKHFGDLTISLQSKIPYKTWWLSVYHPVDKFPQGLKSDLVKAGWKNDLCYAPPFEGREEFLFVKRGSEIFGIWSPSEQKQWMAEIKAILAKHGFKTVPKIRLTAQDLI